MDVEVAKLGVILFAASNGTNEWFFLCVSPEVIIEFVQALKAFVTSAMLANADEL